LGIVAEIIAKSWQTGKMQNNILSLLGFKQVGEFIEIDNNDDDRG
jgi:hypothetical protein